MFGPHQRDRADLRQLIVVSFVWTRAVRTGVAVYFFQKRGVTAITPCHSNSVDYGHAASGGPILTLDSQALGESAHQTNALWENQTEAPARFYPLEN